MLPYESQKHSRSVARRGHNLVAIRPSNQEEVVRHLSAERDTDPLVRDGSHDLTNELLCLCTRSGCGREHKTVPNIVNRLLKTLERDSLVVVRGAALRKS